jgi:hypothetical protein
MAEDFRRHQVRERIHANGLTRLLLHTMRCPLEFYQLSEIGVMLGGASKVSGDLGYVPCRRLDANPKTTILPTLLAWSEFPAFGLRCFFHQLLRLLHFPTQHLLDLLECFLHQPLRPLPMLL